MERSDLDAWEVDDLPADFEDRVMAALEREPIELPEKRSNAPMWIALAAAVVLGVVVAALMRAPAPGDAPPLVVKLAGGAKAYPDPGAVFDVEGSLVRQEEGRVLYEVPSGTPLVVETDAGDVRVGGTRFTVEVMEMNKTTRQKLMGAGALAMGTIAVAVYVHDGSVSLANERGEVRVAAKKTAYATDETAPEIPSEKTAVAEAKTPAKPKKTPQHAALQRAKRDDMARRIKKALESRQAAEAPAADEGEPLRAKIEGKLDKDYIRNVVKEQVIELVRECYNNKLVDDDQFAGEDRARVQHRGRRERGRRYRRDRCGRGLDDRRPRHARVRARVDGQRHLRPARGRRNGAGDLPDDLRAGRRRIRATSPSSRHLGTPSPRTPRRRSCHRRTARSCCSTRPLYPGHHWGCTC